MLFCKYQLFCLIRIRCILFSDSLFKYLLLCSRYVSILLLKPYCTVNIFTVREPQYNLITYMNTLIRHAGIAVKLCKLIHVLLVYLLALVLLKYLDKSIYRRILCLAELILKNKSVHIM